MNKSLDFHRFLYILYRNLQRRSRDILLYADKRNNFSSIRCILEFIFPPPPPLQK